jgi:hypothetical protein
VGFSGTVWACAGAAAGFDASTVDVLVAIAAAAIASGCDVLLGDAGATITSVAATGTAIATATGASGAAVDGIGCDDAAAPEDVAASGAATMSKAASLASVTMPDFAAPNSGLEFVSASTPPPEVAGCVAPGSVSCEAVVEVALEEDVVPRGWRVSAAVSSARGDGRSGAAAAGRPLPVSAALLSISAEKLSAAAAWSVRADFEGVL